MLRIHPQNPLPPTAASATETPATASTAPPTPATPAPTPAASTTSATETPVGNFCTCALHGDLFQILVGQVDKVSKLLSGFLVNYMHGCSLSVSVDASRYLQAVYKRSIKIYIIDKYGYCWNSNTAMDSVLLAVLWWLCYKLSLRAIAECYLNVVLLSRVRWFEAGKCKGESLILGSGVRNERFLYINHVDVARSTFPATST